MDDQEIRWLTSSYSQPEGNCVQVASRGGRVRLVRDSKDPSGPRLQVDGPAWVAFTQAVQSGQFG